MLPTHNRYPYSAITARRPYDWPGGKRLAVYIGLNLEHFAFGEGLGAQLVPGGSEPDVLNFAWRDYGNRVGVWRLMECLDVLGLPASVLVNSEIYALCPQVMAAFRARGDEVVAHGRTNSERQADLNESEERRLIDEVTTTIEHFEGRRPHGWLGPWISQSGSTPDLLQEAGYSYLLDWCCDDQPIWMRCRKGRILALPYPQEINDIPAIMVRKVGASAFAGMIVDQFDEMRRQSEAQPLVMGIALHAYIVGQAHRMPHLRRALSHIAASRSEIWFTTAGAVAEHVQRLPDGTLPSS
jgi:peptidoglycan/xylan/chitin deacetylase (PgdA/CDA1 family)